MGEETGRQALPANFDPVARVYRWAEYLFLGPLLARTRGHFLTRVASAHRVWAFGDGDGRFLASLMARSPTLTVVAVDGSAAMLHLLQQRCAAHASRLRTLQADVLELPLASLGPEPDLVVTHFFLDCFRSEDLYALAARVREHVAPGALWLVSDFAIPPRQPWRFLGALLIRLLYLAFGALTGLRVRRLPETSAALFAAGFRRIHHASWCKGLLYSEIWQAEVSPGRTASSPTAQLPGSAPHPFSCDSE